MSSPLTPHRVECGVTPSSSPVTILYCSVLYGEHECQYCSFVHLIVGVCLFKLQAVRIWSWTLGEAKGGMVVGGGVIMLDRSTLGCCSRGRVNRKKIEHTVC